MGQNCCAISRIFIHKDIYQAFMDCLIAKASKLIVGDPKDFETDIGPVISRAAFENIVSFIKRAEHEGFEIMLGGSGMANKGTNTIHPTIITNVPDDHLLAQDEIFGPVLSVMKPFRTVEEVIPRVNQTPYGLACGIFTNNNDSLDKMYKGIEAGMLWHNTYNIVSPHLPFGGLKRSGLGKDLGIESLRSFTVQKSIYP
jgi:acyl-CoA reductase-like NAD-dependent aldehyde dehydrogenase